MKPIVFAASLALVTAGMVGCSREAPEDAAPEVRVEVRTAVARKGSVDEVVRATGATMVRREAQLRSPMTGVIAKFQYFNGDGIVKGSTVALVRPKEAEAALLGAQQLMESAKNERQKAEAQKAYDLAQNAAGTIALRAPFDGVLSGKVKNEMEVVAEGEQIASLIDPTSMMFVADVPASSSRLIRQGERARIRFSGEAGKSYAGSVHRIEPQVNTSDQTVRVQISFDAKNIKLAGSLFGEAEIVVGTRSNVILVPSAAILRDDERGATVVVLVGADSVAHRVDVVTGAGGDSVVQVSSPQITAGSVVVIRGHYGLPDSTKVTIGQ